MINNKKYTPKKILKATCKHFGIQPERIKNLTKPSSQDLKDDVPRAAVIAQGIASQLGWTSKEIMEEIPRKHPSCCQNARRNLRERIESDEDTWAYDVRSILRLM